MIYNMQVKLDINYVLLDFYCLLINLSSSNFDYDSRHSRKPMTTFEFVSLQTLIFLFMQVDYFDCLSYLRDIGGNVIIKQIIYIAFYISEEFGYKVTLALKIPDQKEAL